MCEKKNKINTVKNVHYNKMVLKKMNTCVVFVFNGAYYYKLLNTLNNLITNGKYSGEICLVIGDDLAHHNFSFNETIKNKITIKHFPNIQFPKEFTEINNKINTDGRNITKKFQWHKLHLFNTFFKKWDYIFYIDCGMTIFSDITPMLNEVTENTLLAHSDAFPTYENKLHNQFDKNNIEYFRKLDNTYNLNIDYFQTGIMLYDTKIINENTFNELLDLTYKFPISRTNEQGIMALYFTNIKPVFKQIKTHNENTHFYDCLSRDKKNKYIMLKILLNN